MERHGVVDAVAEEGYVFSGAAGDLDDPRLLVGADPGEHGGGRDGGFEVVVIERLDLGAAEHAGAVDTDVRAHLGGHQAVVAGDDLHVDS